jgi:hypothetical protein
VLDGYDYAFKSNSIDAKGLRTDTYTIKAIIVNQTYILEVLHLEHNIYIYYNFILKIIDIPLIDSVYYYRKKLLKVLDMFSTY